MDGVLCDFDKSFRDISGMSSEIYNKKFGDKKFWELINSKGIQFWSDLPPMKNMEVLKNFVFNNFSRVGILSSSSRDTSGTDYAERGKLMWLHKYKFTNIISEDDIIIVSSAKKKKLYADKNRILVDDYESNINSWNSSDGIGILHKNIDDTIKELQKYIISRDVNDYV